MNYGKNGYRYWYGDEYGYVGYEYEYDMMMDMGIKDWKFVYCTINRCLYKMVMTSFIHNLITFIFKSQINIAIEYILKFSIKHC